ncbi:MAG: hypothetical protein MAG795_00487 [Candidatus Woesearchaeota archaeon]|nr:hypothetical protein [Candidatus Woesearchaeota archaeon]
MPTPDFDFIGRSKRFGSRYFVNNIDGSHAMLSREQYRNLIQKNLDKKLFSELESKGVIVTDKNIQKTVDKFRMRRSLVFQGPSLHIVIPTLRCNQVCVYCHAASRKMDAKNCDMDEETLKRTVDFIFKTSSTHITIEFQGGEPLVRFDLVKKFYEYATEKNKKYKKDLKFALVTNLTLMDDEKLKYLRKNLIAICTSLDGPKYVHDKNRMMIGGGGSYDKVAKWIKKINKDYKKGHAKLNALVTITKHSLKYPKEIIDEYRSLGLHVIFLRWVDPFGFAGPVWDKISYSAEEFLEFWKKGVDYVYELEEKFFERSSLILLRKMLGKYDPAFLDIANPCGAGIGQLAYMHDGSIYSCDEGRMYGGEFFKLGDVNQSYKKVMTSPKM